MQNIHTFRQKRKEKGIISKEFCTFDIIPSRYHYSYSGFFSNTQESTFAASINALRSKVIFG